MAESNEKSAMTPQEQRDMKLEAVMTVELKDSDQLILGSAPSASGCGVRGGSPDGGSRGQRPLAAGSGDCR